MIKKILSGLIGLTLSLSAIEAQAGLVTFTVKNSAGNPISGVTITKYSGGTTAFGTTDGSGVASANVTGTYSFTLTYNYTTYFIPAAAIGAAPVNHDIYTTGLTLKALASDGVTPIVNATNSFYSSGNRTLANTDVNGETKTELFPGTWNFTTGYHYTSFARSITVGGNGQTPNTTQTETAYTTKLTLQALESDGTTPIVDAGNSFYSSGNRTIGNTDGTGKIDYEMFPGNWSFTTNYHYSNHVRNITVGGTGLASGASTSDTCYTTGLTLAVYESDGLTPVVGAGNTFCSGGNRTIGNTDANGEAKYELFAGTWNFQTSYKYTYYTRSITVLGTGLTPGSLQQENAHTSKVTIDASSYLNAKVQGVTTTYYSGGTRTLGTTDANGRASIQVFPDSLKSVISNKNYTYDTRSIYVPGNGQDPGAETIIYLRLNKVKFSNAGGNVTYYSGGTRTISGSAYYMFPGTYNLKFNGAYTRNVTINEANYNFDKVASILVLRDHNGVLQSIDAARGGITAINYHVTGAASDQSPGVWIDISNYNANTNRIFEVKKNGTISTKTQDVMVASPVGNVFNFQTNLVTLKLQNCGLTGLSGGAIRYGWSLGTPSISAHWGSATDANGEATKELFPGNLIAEMKINQSLEVKNLTITGNDVFTWTTTLVKMHYPGSIAYGGSGVAAHFPGSKEAEMLPGTVNFSFRANGENIVPITVPPYTSGCIYEKTPVIARLISSTNAPLAGGIASRYVSGWQPDEGTTSANGNAVLLYNGNVNTATLRVKYKGATKSLSSVNLASVNNIVVFQTVLATMSLVDADNNPINADAGSLQYYAGSWKTFGSGSTTNGVETMEMLPANFYSFSMRLNNTREQKLNWNLTNSTTVPFTAVKVKLFYQNDCSPVSGAAASYYTGGWHSMGTTDANGNSNVIDMLPAGSYSFKANSTQVNNITIPAQHDYTVTIGSCNVPIRLNNADDKKFNFYPNPATTELVIGVTADNTPVRILSMDGKVLHSQVYNAGTSSINVSSFAPGTYFIHVRQGDKSETFKFIKQ